MVVTHFSFSVSLPASKTYSTWLSDLTTNEETESGSSRVVDDRTSFSRKQNRDIFGKLLYSNGEEQRGQITTSLAHSKHYLYYPLQYVYPYITFPKLNSITVVSSDQNTHMLRYPIDYI
jgi:hypothetical protein